MLINEARLYKNVFYVMLRNDLNLYTNFQSSTQ